MAVVLTSGEPAGIGPDLCVELAHQPWRPEILVAGDPQLLEERAALLNRRLFIQICTSANDAAGCGDGKLSVLPFTLAALCQPGKPNTANSHYVVDMLRRAGEGCLRGEFDGVVTAPVNKAVIMEAGYDFTGHTEYFQALAGSQRVVMMLTAGNLRVALATTHLPLAKVPAAITRELLFEVIPILHRELVDKFGLKSPRLLVCGLNPHAGEGGHLGLEEQTIIEPVLAALRQRGMDLEGPVPADTAFTPRSLAGADAVLAMYHDQGLPVLKHAGFGQAVNITLGLPFIRTSVDHGTAFDLAGTGRADGGSLREAVDCALDLVS